MEHLRPCAIQEAVLCGSQSTDSLGVRLVRNCDEGVNLLDLDALAGDGLSKLGFVNCDTS